MKLFLYRLSSTSLGQGLLSLLTFGISVDNLRKDANGKGSGKNNENQGIENVNHKRNEKPEKTTASPSKNKPFLISITVDTEAGYVDNNERRVWQKEAPDAYQGFYAGIRNLRQVFKRNGVKATFFLSTHCFSANGEEYRATIAELKGLLKDGHEIGLHLHPDSDKALQKESGKEFLATSCFFYDETQLYELIIASKKIISRHLGKGVGESITSIRWGNWALNTDGAKAIKKAGLLVDSSATPGIKGHFDDGRKYDWSRAKEHYPWPLSTKDYQSTNGNETIRETNGKTEKKKSTKQTATLEIPIATFSLLGNAMRADPQYSVILNKAFAHYHENVDRSQKPFPFVVMTHSCEATTKEGTQTQALLDIERFITFAKKKVGVDFSTIADAGKKYGKYHITSFLL